jgi:TRAP transporter TAXI family solute receptor
MTAYICPKVNLSDNHTSKIAMLIALALLILSPGTANAMDLLLGTGETGSFSHFVGKSICRAINRHTADLQCSVAPAANEMHNITNLAGGSLDICLLDSRTIYDAVNRKGNFQYLDIIYDNLLSLQPIYDIPITLAARQDAGITSLDGLKGKRINAGPPGSSQNLMVETIMDAKGWTKKDFSLIDELPDSQSQADMAFCHGTIQAMVHIGVHPDPSVQQLLKLCGANLVGMGDSDIQTLVGSHPAFINTALMGKMYPELAQDIPTMGTSMLLISSRDLDGETVYSIMDALYSSQKKLNNAHPALSSFTDKGAEDLDIGLERHPGAIKFFSDM